MTGRHWLLLAVWVVVIGVSVPFYAIERSMEHFLWHLGYGAAFGVLLAAVWQMRGRHARGAVWALASYGYMVIPDLIWLGTKWTTGTPHPHQQWMDIFLLHVTLDSWPPATPLVLPFWLGAWVLYFVAESRNTPRRRPAQSSTGRSM